MHQQVISYRIRLSKPIGILQVGDFIEKDGQYSHVALVLVVVGFVDLCVLAGFCCGNATLARSEP